MRGRILAVAGALLLFALFLDRRPPPDPRAVSAPASPATTAPVPASLARRERPADPLAAVAQPITAATSPGPARFVLRDRNAGVFFTDRGASFSLVDASPGEQGRAWGLHWEVVDAVASEPRPEGELATRVHSFVGDASRWTTNQAAFSRLRWARVRPGIDLVMESRPGGVEYSFHAEPGADVRSLRLRYHGAEGLRVLEDGSLRVDVGIGSLRERGLRCWQDTPEGRRDVDARYDVVSSDTYAIALGEIDPSRPVVIDPVIGWSTFLGGTRGSFVGGSYALGVDVDALGHMVVTGGVQTTDFPRVGGFGYFGSAGNAFVTRIDPSGTSLVWSTYLGGSTGEIGRAVAVDAAGNVYVTGETRSTDFPTVNAFDATPNGGQDAYVAKISADGSTLVWSSYLGGSTSEYPWGIAVDGGGGAVVSGTTDSANFPVVGGFDATAVGQEVFVSRVAPSGAVLAWSTFLGGSNHDEGTAVAVDAAGNVYVTGMTASADFPVPGGFDTSHNGNVYDGFVAKINAAGSALVWASFLGGSSAEFSRGIAVDPAGNVYVTGMTASSDFPIVGGLGLAYAGASDVYVVKVAAAGSSIVWSTFLGGADFEIGHDLAVDAGGVVTVAGETRSPDFPTANAFDATFGGAIDGFIARLNAAGNALVWSTYIGGAGEDRLNGLGVDASGNAYAAGLTASADFPAGNGFDSTLDGLGDVGVVKVAASGASLVWASFLGGSGSFANDVASDVAVDAAGNVIVTGETAAHNYPTPGGFDTTIGWTSDAVVTKIAPDGTSILWSSYLGGNGEDGGRGVAVDASGNIYVTGFTRSSDFPANGGFDATPEGSQDAFICKVAADGSGVLWSSYLGGNFDDLGRSVAVDGAGRVYVVGETRSTNFPAAGGFDASYGGGQLDGFIVKVHASGSSLLWGSYLGGAGDDVSRDVAVDADGNVYVAGHTTSADFPVPGGFITTRPGGLDGFVTKINAAGASLAWSSYLGGGADDAAHGVALDLARNVYVCGWTASSGFPRVAPIDDALGGSSDAFVARVAADGSGLDWSTFLGGSGGEAANAVATDGANVLVTGQTSSANFPSVGGASYGGGSSDVFLAAYDLAGTSLLGASSIGGSSGEEGHGIAVNAAGLVTLVGQTSSYDFPSSGAFDPLYGPGVDGFVMSIDPEALPVPPPPPPPSSGSAFPDIAIGFCGLSGVEVFLALAMIAVYRRRQEPRP